MYQCQNNSKSHITPWPISWLISQENIPKKTNYFSTQNFIIVLQVIHFFLWWNFTILHYRHLDVYQRQLNSRQSETPLSTLQDNASALSSLSPKHAMNLPVSYSQSRTDTRDPPLSFITICTTLPQGRIQFAGFFFINIRSTIYQTVPAGNY